MLYTVYDLKRAVNGNLPGGGLSQVQNVPDTFDKARRAVIGRVKPPELRRTAYLEDALYPSVDRYAVPVDMNYSSVLQLQLLSGYRNVDTMEHPLELVYSRRFNQKRGGAANVMNISYDNGVKYANVFRPSGQSRGGLNNTNSQSNCLYRVIQNCDSLSSNGSWNVSGNVINLREDKLTHVVGRGSLQFDINDSSTTGSLENFSLTPFDINDFLQKGALFAWLDIPLPKEMISVELTMGSNPNDLTTDLYTAAVNQPHDNNEFVSGWNLLKYMLRNLTMIGTPNPRALTYIKIEFSTTGAPIPNCHLDNIILRQGAVYELTYESSYILRDAKTGAWKKIFTDNSDIIVAEEDTFDLLVDEMTLAAQRESFQAMPGAQSSIESIGVTLEVKYKKYLREHKSEAIAETDEIHVFGNQYDGYTDDPMPGFGDQYGQYGDYPLGQNS